MQSFRNITNLSVGSSSIEHITETKMTEAHFKIELAKIKANENSLLME